MILETQRLILDTWQTSDWTAFRPIATDPDVMRYITGGVPWTDDQIRSFVERQVKLYSERGFCRWKLLSKASGEMIGFCGVGFGATRRTRSSDGGWRVASGVTGWRRKRLLPRCSDAFERDTAGANHFRCHAGERGFDSNHCKNWA